MIIMAIEGGVGSGKTSLLKCLGKRIPGVHIVPEYFDIIPPEQHDATLAMPEDDKLALFLEIEKQRKKDLERLSPELVILDRSFLTLLAYQYATNQYDRVSADLLSKYKMATDYILPDVILHLDVEDAVRKERVEGRGYPVAPVLVEPFYNQRMRDYLNRFENAGFLKTIDTTTLSMQEICDFSYDTFMASKPQELSEKARLYSYAARESAPNMENTDVAPLQKDSGQEKE